MQASLSSEIEQLLRKPQRSREALGILQRFRAGLNTGEVSVLGEGSEVQVWVKQGILLHAALGGLAELAGARGTHWDLDTFPPRVFRAEDRVRVAQGAVVRDGARIGTGSMLLAGSTVQIGAVLGKNCQIDAGCYIGLCAQLGDMVSMEAGSRIGGVLTPFERIPVVVREGSVLSMGSQVSGSVEIGTNSLVAAGVFLTDAMPVWDHARQGWIRAQDDGRLVLPANAVYVNGVLPQSLGSASGLLTGAMVLGYASEGERAAEAYRRLIQAAFP